MPTVTTSTELRDAIQAASFASGTEIISLDGTNEFSVVTLAKLVCVTPPPYPESGYTVQGSGQTITNTRIYQENIDGPYSPGNVLGATDPLNPQLLTFSYTSNGATDGTALLRSTSGSYVLDSLYFTGTHRGWDGNSNLYMSLTTSVAASPINVDLTLSNSIIDIVGQQGFNPTVTNGGGSAFLHSFNNLGTVVLEGNIFDEAGFLSSFNFFNQSDNTVGNYFISSNIFTRSSNTSVVRRRGNRLTNATAELTNNTFENGAFLDVFGNIGGISFDGANNVFDTIANGFGIRGSDDPVLGPLTNAITLSTSAVVTFTGAGSPLKYVSTNPGSLTLDTMGLGGVINIGGLDYLKASVGGQAGDVLDAENTGTPTTKYWAFGDQGNDTIFGAAEEDYLDGGEGDDSITASSGNDTLLGGTGSDTILGDAGSDSIDGGDGGDLLEGGSGNDTILCGTGDDVCLGGQDNDSIVGDVGNDSLSGDAGNDTIDGGDGLDTLNGGAGNDILTGGNFADLLNGDGGNDTISGDAGIDTLTGGSGADSLTGGTDTINSFIQLTTDSQTFTARSSTGVFAVGQTFTYGNRLDIITDFKAGAGGDLLDIQGSGALPTSALGRTQTSVGGLVAGTNYFLSGTFVGNIFTVQAAGAGGSSTMILQGTGGNFNANASAILLSGVNSSSLSASNFI
jgi:Ca2+-binding RTX toxin-like protein